MAFKPISLLRQLAILALCLGLLSPIGVAVGQTQPPTKVDTLLNLLSDPEVKTWIDARNSKSPSVPSPQSGMMAPAGLSSALDIIRFHIGELAAAIPTLPAQFERAWVILRLEFEDEGIASIIGLIFGFTAVGYGLDWLVRRLATPYRNWMKALRYDTPQGRVRNLAARLVYSAMLICAFVLGTAGVFLAFTWPPLLREIVLGYLSVGIATRATMMISRAFLMPPSLGLPQASQIRVFPMTDERAEHWYRWIAINVFWLMFVVVTLALMGTFGFDMMGRLSLSIPTSFVQLVLILIMIWRRPRVPMREGPKQSAMGRAGWSWLLSVYFTVVWMVQVSGTWKLYWAIIAVVALPAAIWLGHRGVTYLLRPPEPEVDARPIEPVLVAVIDRGIRVALILVAAFVLARVWGIDILTMTAGDAWSNRILRGALNVAVIVLAADFGWSIVKAVIARRLGSLDGPVHSGHGPDANQARMKTLLPIFQNMLFAAILVMAVLMVLSSVGIEIGPLIAGAGVVGVAIGFGAQTLVKDIISGIFYLLDDAFRVGEYIQSGTYRGTIESFSLRSVKLRHHRGYLFTVPFGELGAVQNMSRDWVIDKFSINVDYDTDVEKARKIIKKIGLQFLENPEYAPHIIEPLKMQGVEKFGDFGIELRMKMMTKPGEQFIIRRKAFVAIKKAFEENGIKIPFPTVHVREGESQNAAAAQAMLSAKAAAAVPTEGS